MSLQDKFMSPGGNSVASGKAEAADEPKKFAVIFGIHTALTRRPRTQPVNEGDQE